MDIVKKPPTKKVIWYVSYIGPSITADELHTKTKLAVDECYTSHGPQKNTLLHLSKRVYKRLDRWRSVFFWGPWDV